MPFLCDVTIEETGVVVGYWQETELVYNMKSGYVRALPEFEGSEDVT